jgi:hypothetical protein
VVALRLLLSLTPALPADQLAAPAALGQERTPQVGECLSHATKRFATTAVGEAIYVFFGFAERVLCRTSSLMSN